MSFKVLSIPILALLSACTASTSFQSTDPDVTLHVNKTAAISLSEPSEQTYKTTSFGQYVFKASKEGKESMYGLIPLKFNGGYLAADILFFAPAMFFNLREVYPYYEFDIEKGVVRYKKKDTDPWHTYTATKAEIERAQLYFGHKS